MDLFARTALSLVLFFSVIAARAQKIDPELDFDLENGAALSAARRGTDARSHLAPPRNSVRHPAADEAAPNETSTPAAPAASVRETYTPSVKGPSHFSLVIPSVAVHGFAISKDVGDQMPRKLDNGQTVATPGVGLQYVSNGGLLLLSGMFKDCYDNFAGTFQIGQQFNLGTRTTFGYSAGLYVRETPIECQTKMDRSGRKTTSCEEFDQYQLKWMTSINHEWIDLIPMPFLHFSTALYKDRDVEVDLKIMTNFALSEFGIAIPL